MEIRLATGRDLVPHLDEVARLRIAIFREWPYLYDGDVAYERGYLETYARSPDSLAVLAVDDGRVVGVSTGVPLADEAESFVAPLRAAGIDPAGVFYFGESVLLPDYRGRGLGHRFFHEREQHATRLGRFTTTAFCAVARDEHDARKPASYRSLEPFWQSRGYTRREGVTTTIAWRELGERVATRKTLAFWTRPLA